MGVIETEEAAKRLARVIVSDIEIYNKDKFHTGADLTARDRRRARALPLARRARATAVVHGGPRGPSGQPQEGSRSATSCRAVRRSEAQRRAGACSPAGEARSARRREGRRTDRPGSTTARRRGARSGRARTRAGGSDRRGAGTRTGGSHARTGPHHQRRARGGTGGALAIRTRRDHRYRRGGRASGTRDHLRHRALQREEDRRGARSHQRDRRGPRALQITRQRRADGELRDRAGEQEPRPAQARTDAGARPQGQAGGRRNAAAGASGGRGAFPTRSGRADATAGLGGQRAAGTSTASGPGARETWRSQRWSSFVLNTPNSMSLLPGEPDDPASRAEFMARDAFVARLQAYADRRRLPIRTATTVTAVTSQPGTGSYTLAVRTDAGPDELSARTIVVASGGQRVPRVPAIARDLPAAIRQIAAADYRDPWSLPAGAVLVVGGAQTGVQVVEDLLAAGRTVYLCTSAVGRFPRRYRGEDILESPGSDRPVRHPDRAPAGPQRPVPGQSDAVGCRAAGPHGQPARARPARCAPARSTGGSQWRANYADADRRDERRARATGYRPRRRCRSTTPCGRRASRSRRSARTIRPIRPIPIRSRCLPRLSSTSTPPAWPASSGRRASGGLRLPARLDPRRGRPAGPGPRRHGAARCLLRRPALDGPAPIGPDLRRRRRTPRSSSSAWPSTSLRAHRPGRRAGSVVLRKDHDRVRGDTDQPALVLAIERSAIGFDVVRDARPELLVVDRRIGVDPDPPATGSWQAQGGLDERQGRTGWRRSRHRRRGRRSTSDARPGASSGSSARRIAVFSPCSPADQPPALRRAAIRSRWSWRIPA